jgi:hypothetical protein
MDRCLGLLCKAAVAAALSTETTVKHVSDVIAFRFLLTGIPGRFDRAAAADRPVPAVVRNVLVIALCIVRVCNI